MRPGRQRDVLCGIGAILYDCLTGRPPFLGKTVVETLDLVRTQEPVPPSRWQAIIPPELEAVCLKCLEKSPTHRYASAQELADDLERWRNGDATRVRPWSWRRRLTRRLRRHWKPIAAALLALLTAGSAILVTAVLSSPEYRERQAILGVDRAIRSGERVVLIGPTGPPRWYRQPVDITTLSADPSSVFQVDAGSAALIELAPAAHHDRYRLSAELRTRASKTTGSWSGIYFAHNHGPGNPTGFVERLVVVRHRRNLLAQVPGNEPVNVHDFLVLSRDGVTILNYPSPFGVHYYKPNPLGMNEPWRYLEVEVTPETIRAQWREEDGRLQLIGTMKNNIVDAIPVDSFHQGTQWRAKELDDKKWKDVPRRIEYKPRGALGLFVEKAVVDFRNVVYEPLVVESAP